MTRLFLGFASACAIAIGGPLVLLAQAPQSASADIELQLGDLLMNEARFRDAQESYRRAIAASHEDAAMERQARSGLVMALLRTGDFTGSHAEALRLVSDNPQDGHAHALLGDTLWGLGRFDEAEEAYDTALKDDIGDARAHHGRAAILTARNRFAEALVEAQQASKLAPREPEFHHTIGVIYERQHRFDEAAVVFGNYVNLLPNRDHSEKAMWTRAEIRFLDSFKGLAPVDFSASGATTTWTVPIRIDKDKVFVRLKINGAGPMEFVLDTGAEQTVVSRDLARKRGILPITYMPSAGVGDIGFRGLQIGRIDSIEIGDLKVKNVPCLIKNPPLGEIPGREPDSFSPLALGLSMRVDYARRQLVIARELPREPHATELPLWLYRLATVRGTVNGQPTTFVVDTGGEAISISQTTAGNVTIPPGFRKIPLKVYGTSGWDKDAFLMPSVDLEFSSIRFSKIPVVVLNLRAPSALLGYELGGIVGHKFLSKYRVSIDLQRSVVGLD
ncbi:MAG TPA: aspartyl protease family protein, partial [Vicinamibacterales bacterium]|jgi:Flp pilus assembly protein TadD/predicted aspartyl protease